MYAINYEKLEEYYATKSVILKGKNIFELGSMEDILRNNGCHYPMHYIIVISEEKTEIILEEGVYEIREVTDEGLRLWNKNTSLWRWNSNGNGLCRSGIKKSALCRIIWNHFCK